MNKKRILITLLIVFTIMILVCQIIFIFRKYQNVNAENFESATLQTTEENIVHENEVIDIPITEVAEKNVPTKEIEIKESTETPVYTNHSVENKISNKEQLQVKQETQVKVQEQPKTEIVKPTQTQKQTQQSKGKEENKEVPAPISQNTIQVTKDEEKYVKNDAMINRIKQVIQSNESEYMKTYGYSVVVDSSIKQQANQFTFTENRVKSYIAYRFGTIKIYAEDYYKNGQLIMTECYIY